MESGIRTANFGPFAELLANGGNQCIPSRGIRGVGPAEMTIEMAFADEIRESELLQARRFPCLQSPLAAATAPPTIREDEISQPQGRKENLGERSYVNDAAFPVESGQRLKRRSVITIFTVIVVLNDECPYTGGPIEKLEAPRDWQDYAGRKLMGRSNVRKPERSVSRLVAFGIWIPSSSTADVTNSAPAAMNAHRAPV